LQKVVREGWLRVWKTGENACWHAFTIDDKFFSLLQEIDREIARQVAQAGCPHCGGRLDRSDYNRKPRGDLFLAPAVELPLRRISFCCCAEGCRRRATPPSVVFLGRRVYLGAVVLVASMIAQLPTRR
jgi:transposase